MSAQFDTAAQNHNNSVTFIDTPITVGANSNRVLVVLVTTANGESVTSVTGAGATWSGSAFGTIAGAGGSRGETWIGTNPTVGAQTVTVNFSASLGNEGFVDVESWYNADQVTPSSNYDGFNPGSGSNVTRAQTTTNGDGAACQLADASGSATCSPAIDVQFQTGGGFQVACTHGLATGSSFTFTWTNTNGKVYQAVTVNQSASGVPNLPRVTVGEEVLRPFNMTSRGRR